MRAIWLILLMLALPASAAERILVQSTTSTQNSGLYDYLLPLFEADTGYDVQVVAVGTGQALRNAEAGDADLLIVHAPAAEAKFIAKGFGLKRHEFMYNDFVVIGPKDDPARISSTHTVVQALGLIDEAAATFVSRGDDSGTHKKELALWELAGLTPGGTTYIEAGSGMGATLRMAVEMGAYTLADRGTWIAFEGKNDAALLFEGDPPLNNQYSIILVNPAKHPHVNVAGAEALRDWLLSPKGQKAIAAFRVHGEQLFIPNAP